MDFGITRSNGVNFEGSLLDFDHREMTVLQAIIDN
jgi:hypothetical protein